MVCEIGYSMVEWDRVWKNVSRSRCCLHMSKGRVIIGED